MTKLLPRWFPVAGLLMAFALLAPAADPPRPGPGAGKPAAAKTDAPADPLPEGAKARLGTDRYRVGSSAAGVALSPDGKTLAFLTGDSQIAFMDAATGTVTRRLAAGEHARAGYGLGYAPDGKRGVVFGPTGVVVVDLESGRPLARVNAGVFLGLRAGTFAFSADGNRLAVGSASGGQVPKSVAVWDVAGDKAVATVRLLQNQSASVALSADGKTLVTWGDHLDPAAIGGNPPAGAPPAQVVQIWDVEKQAERGRVTARQAVGSVALSPDGAVLAVASGNGPVELFETATGKAMSLLAPRGAVKSLVFSPHGKWLAALGHDGATVVWDLERGTRVGVVEGPVGTIIGLVFTADERAVAWGARGSIAALWEVPSGRPLTPVRGHSEAVHSVVILPDGKTVLSGGVDGRVIEWDAATGAPIKSTAVRLPDPGDSIWSGQSPVVVLAPTGAHYTASTGETVVDRATGTTVMALGGSGRSVRLSSSALPVFSADGARVLHTGGPWLGRPGELVVLPVWEVASGRKVAEVSIQAGESAAAAFSPDGTRLVTLVNLRRTSPEQSLVITGWDLKTGKKLGECTRTAQFGLGTAVAAVNNTSAVVVSADGRLWAVDYDGGRVGDEIDRAWRTVWRDALAVAPDGKRFAIGGMFGEGRKPGIRVYDWPRGKVLHTFTGHTGPVTALAFSADGKTLASGSADTTVLLWDVAGVGK